MRFFFRRKPINSLDQALQLVSAAMQIIWEHKRVPSFRAAPEDFEMLKEIRLRLWHACNEAEHVMDCLQRRADNPPEGMAQPGNVQL